MPNEFNIIGLYDHNADSYRKVRNAFNSGEKVVGIVHATGTGKTYNALQLAYDNKHKKITYVVPSNGIIEHIKKTITNNPNLNYERDFPNLEFVTYQKLSSMEDYELESFDTDLLILDEFHHIGAPIWGKKVQTLINTHPNMNVFGMTAYTVRDRGTQFERDMANPETEELFSNKIVSRFDLCDAWLEGVLPFPNYKTSRIKLAELEMELETKAKSMNASSPDYLKNMAILNNVKKLIHNAPTIKDIMMKNIKNNGKYIYFCPPGAFEGENDIETIKKEALEWFKEIANEEDIVFYTTTSNMGIEGKKNRDAFYNDETLDGKSADGKLRVMFAINQYNEGIHAPNIDGVIMGRGTSSDIIFFEQIGRALSVRGNTKKEFDKYEEYNIEELISICKAKGIQVKENTSKEMLIEKLIAPVIIDLTDNIDMIRNLENNLKDRIKLYQEKETGTKYFKELEDISFDIEIQNEDIYEVLMDLKSKLTLSFTEKCIEYFEIVNEDKKIPIQDDTRQFSDGTKINVFWNNNKEKLNELIQQEEYRIQYPIAYEIITNAYQEYLITSQSRSQKKKENPNWKYEEYFQIVDKDGELPKASYNETRVFSDGSKIAQFWNCNKEKINELIQQDEYRIKYPVAYEVITRNYQEYLIEIQKNQNNPNWKYEEYFEIVNEDKKIPTQNDTRQFSDATKVAHLWSEKKEKINELIQKEEYKVKYPIAYEVIIRRYHEYAVEKQRNENNPNWKYEEYFEIVNEDKKIPTRSDTRQFSDGVKISLFWKRNKEKLNELIQKEEYKVKYPVAYEVIIRRYHEDVVEKQRNKNNPNWKYEEYFEIVNEDKKIPSSTDTRVFSNDDRINQFWTHSKEKLNELIQQEEYRIKYPIAYEIIVGAYREYMFNQNNPNWKYEEYFEIVNEDKKIPTQNDTRQFSDATKVENLWSDKKEKINELIQKEEYKMKYPIAYEIITEVYREYLIGNLRKMDNPNWKYEEYFEIVNEDKKIPTRSDTRQFSDGVKISQFWSKNKEILNELIQQEEYRTKYPIAYQVITVAYKEFKEIQRKKQQSLIDELCLINNIDMELNKEVLEHVIYEELYAKICLLNELSISLCYSDGKLHEIFSMSSMNMKVKFGFTMEELLKEYPIKKKGM